VRPFRLLGVPTRLVVAVGVWIADADTGFAAAATLAGVAAAALSVPRGRIGDRYGAWDGGGALAAAESAERQHQHPGGVDDDDRDRVAPQPGAVAVVPQRQATEVEAVRTEARAARKMSDDVANDSSGPSRSAASASSSSATSRLLVPTMFDTAMS
jgi:hypothetical protein